MAFTGLRYLFALLSNLKLNSSTKSKTMKDLTKTWSFLQLLIYASVALTGILLIIYGIYHFAATFLPPLLETANNFAS